MEISTQCEEPGGGEPPWTPGEIQLLLEGIGAARSGVAIQPVTDLVEEGTDDAVEEGERHLHFGECGGRAPSFGELRETGLEQIALSR